MHRETGNTMDASPVNRAIPLGALIAIGIAAVQLLFLFCFSYPPTNATPKEIPLGISGPDPAIQQLGDSIGQSGDTFEIRTYPDIEAARQAIRDREIYGAIVIEADGTTLLVSSAASPAIATMLKSHFTSVVPDGQMTVEDVVPASAGDPNGSGFLTSVLPLTLLSLALGTVVGLVEGRPIYALGWIALTAVISASGASWITSELGIFTGHFWSTSLVFALLVFGIGVTSQSLTYFATSGKVLDLTFALVLLCLGIPGAGALVPRLLLVEPWRSLGWLLPPGAAVDTLRGVNFFAGAGIAAGLWVLIGWVLIGLSVSVLRRVKHHA
ncbi:MAG: hypothetical protein KC435_09790 [Thermomicrobiales bacterium]|nr:hypothetical protein [Thermomicrobiales bacterium]